MYQLWLDDLYPRAKFGDGLTIIEKLGHSRQMQLQRKAWIEEGKPKLPVEDEDPDHDDYQPRSSRPGSKHGGEIARAGTSSSRPSAEPDPGGDEGNGLDRERDGRPKQAGPSHDQSIQSEPDEDELDALLAEEPSEATNRPAPQRPGPATERSFDDDEEAMREMEGMDEL
jgi:replication fork protection complex subunit Csm3/Swi3